MDAQDFLNRCSDYPQNRKHDFIVRDLINVVEECRHWIIGGRLKAFTVYVTGTWVCSGGPSPAADAQHHQIALEAAEELGHGVCVIDTARISDGRYVVVEANPPWCSSFYSAPPAVIREAVLGSQGLRAEDRFVPDQAVRDAFAEHPWVRRRPLA